MGADDGGLGVRDHDLREPERSPGPEAHPERDRRPDAQLGGPDLWPGPQEQQEHGGEGAVLGDGDDRDLGRQELIEMAEWDLERDRGGEHSGVGGDERRERHQNDRPEAPAPGGGWSCLGDLYRRPVRRARRAASSTTWLKSEESGLGVRVKTPISATPSGTS